MSAVSQLFGTVRAVDVLFMHDEALVGQGQRALLTVKAVLMPSVVLIVHHISPSAKTCKKHIHVSLNHRSFSFPLLVVSQYSKSLQHSHTFKNITSVLLF